jgi:hypothetical protein
MIGKLQKKYDALEKSLTDVIKHLDSLSEDERTSSEEGVWSPVEVLYHLWQSETGTCRYLEKKLQAAPTEVEKAGISSLIRSNLLNQALRNKKKKYKVPKVLDEMPEKIDFEELKNSFTETRSHLKNILERFDENMSKRAYFKHPRAGRLNISQAMDFLMIHFDRHVDQIKERTKRL